MGAKKKTTKVKNIKIPNRIFVQVENGIKFLDNLLGRKEWLRRMNMDMFNINRTQQCVCGNVFKNGMNGYDAFVQAMHLLHVEDHEGIKFGFYTDKNNDWPFLQDVWVAEINKMKKAAKIK